MIGKLMDPLTVKVIWFGYSILLPLEDSTGNSTDHGQDLTLLSRNFQILFIGYNTCNIVLSAMLCILIA